MADSLFESTVDLVWRQWRAIGGGAATSKPATKQVDPEALCLASLVLQDQEARLWTVMADWLRFGASLLSVQRIKNLATQFPVDAAQLSGLAQTALREGKDARWRSLIGSTKGGARVVREQTKQRSRGVALTAPPALLLRLRAAFNVGVKSDLLAFLLGQPFRVAVSTAAASLGYGVPAVFRALQDLLRAGFVRSADLPAATEYWVDIPTWYDVLGGPDAIPRWGAWREVLVYACAAFDLEHRGAYLKSSEYARASALRDLAAKHEAGLVRSGLVVQGIPRSADVAEWGQFHSRLGRAISAAA